MIKKPGFTLIELLIVMGIMGILLILLTEVFGAILAMRLRSQTTSDLAQDSRYLLSRLTYDIARSSDITLPPAASSGDSLLLTIGGTTHLYTLANNTVLLSVGDSPGEALTGINTKITNLSFTQFFAMGGKKSVQ